MNTRRILGSFFGAQCALAITFGLGACSNSNKTTPDAAASPDLAVPQDLAAADRAAPDITQGADAPAADTPQVLDVAVDAAAVDAATGAADGAGSVADAGGADAGTVCPPPPTTTLPSGTAPMQAAGPAQASTATRPQLSQVVADGQYTILKALAGGGLMTTITPADGGAVDDAGTPDSGTLVSFAINDDWDPVTNGIGDPSKFTPVFTVAADGSGTHTTVQAALDQAILLAPCARAYVRVMPGEYREQVTLKSKTSAPPITLYSTDPDASKTRIVFNSSAATAGGMSASVTFTIKALSGFQAKNLTFANDYVVGSATGDDQSAVALLNQCDRAQFENVRFLGHVSTLYVKSLDIFTVARSYFRDCYLEGDQEIVLGRGTAVFDHTEIKYLAGRQPTGGVLAAPSTLLDNRYGFLFVSCQFTAEAGASAIALAHQWWEGGQPKAVGKMVVRNSTLGSHILSSAPWAASPTRTTTPKNPSGTTPVTLYASDDYFAAGTGPAPAEPYLAEYGNSGPGAGP